LFSPLQRCSKPLAYERATLAMACASVASSGTAAVAAAYLSSCASWLELGPWAAARAAHGMGLAGAAARCPSGKAATGAAVRACGWVAKVMTSATVVLAVRKVELTEAAAAADGAGSPPKSSVTLVASKACGGASGAPSSSTLAMPDERTPRVSTPMR
jgi:hypothetical protein